MSPATASRRSTILVVEDEAGIARMIQVLLEARGFGALVTHSGDEALQRVAEHPVDLVLLDVMMPGMDGYEVCRRLKSDPRSRHIPVVMLTAKDAVRDMVLGLEIGADEYITKPFNTDELIARIRVLLRIQGMSLELLRRNRELQALNAVALSVSRSLSLEQILEGALAGTMDSLGLDCGLVHLIEPRSGALELRAQQGPAPPDQVRRLPRGSSWAWQVLEAEEPLVLADAGQATGLGRASHTPAEPLAAVALRFQERRLGVLTVVGRPGQEFTADELGLLGAIARQVSLALENSRLYSQSRRKAQEFEALYQVSRAMASSLELQEILERISRSVSGLLEGRAMALMLLGPDGHSLTTVAGYNLADETPEVSGAGRAAWNSPSVAAVREKRPIAVADLGNDDGYAEWAAAVTARGYRSCLAIPLIVQDRALGCMNVYGMEPHDFGEDEVQLFSTFASQAAVSIENARLFEETRQLAITDPLTGLANHRQFYNQLSREVRRAQRYERPLSLLMLDLDHFKQFNDRYGHLAGDQALREVAEVLRQNARSVDILARYGGEEFALILPETDLKRAASQAERVRAAVAAFPFLGASAGPGSLTVSIGVAALLGKMRKGQDLVHDADQALYRAKAQGRNRMESAPAE
ncbi:MAG: diguanylate cyclase [Candidatus Methylomirabilales bacterium]